MRICIGFDEEQSKFLLKLTNSEKLSRRMQGKKIGEEIRSIVNLLRNETLILTIQDQLVGVVNNRNEKVLTAAQIKAMKNKGKRDKNTLLIDSGSLGGFGDVMAELKERFKKNKDTEEIVNMCNNSITEIRKAMMVEYEQIQENMKKNPPPPPPEK